MRNWLLAASAIFLLPVPAAAKPTDDVAIGTAFIDTCVRKAPDGGAIRTGIDADPLWVKTDLPSDFGLKPKAKAPVITAWKRMIDGKEVLLVLLSEPQSKGLQNNCAFVVRDERSAMWYFRSVSDQLKAYGMKLNQQDIPHWRYHKGKFANGQKGEVELRSKSAALPGKDILHLAIAY
jgi:hypothetical protein